MKNLVKRLIIALGLAPLMACYGTLLWIFLTAYDNGGKTTILINKFNEGNIELIGIIISFPFVLYLIYLIIKKIY